MLERDLWKQNKGSHVDKHWRTALKAGGLITIESLLNWTRMEQQMTKKADKTKTNLY